MKMLKLMGLALALGSVAGLYAADDEEEAQFYVENEVTQYVRAHKEALPHDGATAEDRDLVGADLSGANLNGADLKDANLKNANLMNADLSGAVLVRATLDGANLTGAKFRFARLEDATFKGAKQNGKTVTEKWLKAQGADLGDDELEASDFGF